jgi:NADH-quinone oxidoreductase subunit M
MYQHVMLGETNRKLFADVTFQEGLVFVIIIAVIFFFGLYPKPINELITPSLDQILRTLYKIQ